MELIHLITLALLQGITEFLPISSSGHLILLPYVTGWPDHGLVFDIAAHLGSLAAVIIYFRRDLGSMTHAWCRSALKNEHSNDSRLAWFVILATIPVGIAGLVAHDFVATELRSPMVIIVTTVFFGVLLWLADTLGPRRNEIGRIRGIDVLVIGIAQAVALIPGTSRSGITITAGLAMGLSRTAAARFSFLLAVPVIVLAGAFEIMTLIRDPAPVDWPDLLITTLLAGVSAYLCIFTFMRLLERIGLWPFAVYRLVLGAALWLMFY